MSMWISINDRLPENDDYVLACFDDGFITGVAYVNNDCELRADSGEVTLELSIKGE